MRVVDDSFAGMQWMYGIKKQQIFAMMNADKRR
jgi:hypothetical protein